MKTLLFLLLLNFSAYSQNFMMYMDIQENTIEGQTINYYNTKVLWGIEGKELCMIWENHKMICFTKQPYYKIPSRRLREKIRLYLKDSINVENEKYLKLRNIFINQWGEIFLISIYIDDDVSIYIACLNGKFPHYHFQMVPKINDHEVYN